MRALLLLFLIFTFLILLRCSHIVLAEDEDSEDVVLEIEWDYKVAVQEEDEEVFREVLVVTVLGVIIVEKRVMS